ncbi:MAG: hypothetical protein CMO81_03275 [Waddliaceae bacterium]|nr:hypothetical protein [Waddliaceae bacterium]
MNKKIFNLFLFFVVNFNILQGFTQEEYSSFLNGQVYEKAKRAYIRKARSLDCRLMGSGGRFAGGINSINFMFQKRGFLSEKEALHLLQKLMRQVVRVYLDYPEFAPFVDFPMNSDMFSVTVCFYGKDGSSPTKEDLSIVSIHSGRLLLQYERDPSTLAVDFIKKECGYKLITVDDLDKPLETWLPPEEDQG